MLDRLIIVGFDGGTFDVFVPLAQAGVMPNLAALMERSALGQLRSTQPAITPTAWTTFLTGCDPHRHGIWDYRWLDLDGRLGLNSAARIAEPTLFDRVLQGGGQVVSINLPMTAACPDGRGLIVAGIDCPSAAAALVPYPAFARRLTERGIELPPATIWRRRPHSLDELTARAAATERDFLARSAAALAADEMSDWRLLCVQFQSLDCVQHRLWHLFDFAGGGGPEPWLAQVRRIFAALDRALGELIELAQRRGAGLLVVSDHGFGPFREKISVPELLRRRGLLTPQSARDRIAYRAARTWLKLRKWSGRRLSRAGSAAGVRRSLAALLPLDWQRSIAFSAHGNLGALVYLNSARRFGSGPLASPRDERQAAADVVAALREARHPETGEILFIDAYATAERFDVDPSERGWPEVIGIPADGFHTRHKFDRGGKLMRPDPDMAGTHRREGVFMANLPGALLGRGYEADLRDVAPTVLRWLGLPGGEAMQGRVLHELFSSGDTPRLAATSRAITDPHLARQVHAPQEEAAILERLRALGYID